MTRALPEGSADTGGMDPEQWWPSVSDDTRRWLIEHNGEPVPDDVIGEITKAGGVVTADAWWVDEVGEDGAVVLSDAAVDWIEAIANSE